MNRIAVAKLLPVEMISKDFAKIIKSDLEKEMKNLNKQQAEIEAKLAAWGIQA